MGEVIQRQFCANHPSRVAHALCMDCKKTVCQECATRWEGINYCITCLEKRRVAAAPSASMGGWALLLASVTVLFFAKSKLMAWSAALMVAFLEVE